MEQIRSEIQTFRYVKTEIDTTYDITVKLLKRVSFILENELLELEEDQKPIEELDQQQKQRIEQLQAKVVVLEARVTKLKDYSWRLEHFMLDSRKSKEAEITGMTSLIQDYEQQYAVLSAEITAEIGKLSRIPGGDRKELITKINSNLEEVQELLEQIGLEIRDADTGNKTGLTNRLNCYLAELKRLRQEFVNAKNQRNETTVSLFESSDFENVGINEEQQRRLLDNSERIERTGNRLTEAYRTVLETETIGSAVLQDLSDQREKIQTSRARLRETNEDLRLSSRIMNSMIMRSIRESAMLYGVILLFVVVVSLSIYLSMSK